MSSGIAVLVGSPRDGRRVFLASRVVAVVNAAVAVIATLRAAVATVPVQMNGLHARQGCRDAQADLVLVATRSLRNGGSLIQSVSGSVPDGTRAVVR